MTDPLHPDRLLTRDETAEAFGVSKRWLEHAATVELGANRLFHVRVPLPAEPTPAG